MERGLVMFMHSALIGLVSYVVMVFALGQSAAKAENRSLIFGALVLIYMIVFGHKLPSMNMNMQL
jgi:hypothetical protein